MALNIKPLSATQYTLKLALQNQDVLTEVSKSIASGIKTDTFKGLAKDATTENFLNFSATLTEIKTHIASNTSAIARTKAADTSISGIQELATELAGLITQRRNGASGENIPLDVQVGGLLDKLAGKLNIKFDGRYLFAGSSTDTKPVQDIHTSNLADINGATVVTDSYYYGDNDIVSVRSSDSEAIDYGIPGNDIGFKNLIGAANLAINGHAANSDTLLAQAMDLTNTAIAQLTSTRATARIAIERMQKANTSHDDFNLFVQANLNDISQTNLIEASANAADLRSIISAGFSTYASQQQLTLLDYLR